MNSVEGYSGEANSGSFAEEFEKYCAGKLDNIAAGNIVPGTVVEIDREMVIVDIGFKSSGLIPVEQFKDRDGKITVKAGDKIDVMIMALENEQDQILLSFEKAMQKRVWQEVEDVFKSGASLTGTIVQKVKGGLQVDIGIPAFLPGSQIDIRPHRNLDKFLGETQQFKVLKITKDKGNIVLSRRAVLMTERSQLRSETLKVLNEGVIMEGTVKNITDYGAFIDLGGIDGLLHITDVSWGRINHPAEKLSVGQIVPVVVLKYDQEKERVSLGMKQLHEDPWSTVGERYPVGGKISGKVTNITDYGVFVELEEGVEGLVHVSEMSWTKKVRSPAKLYAAGDVVEAVVLGIDSEQQRINLGTKQLTPNPWETLSERLPIGSRVTGKVRSIMDFGIFVGIEDGIDGLVHVSDFSWTKKIKDPKEIQERFKKGDEVEAVILDIDQANERLSLGIKQMERDPWETIVQRYPVGSRVKGTITSIADFGVFVELEEGIEGLVHTSQLDAAAMSGSNGSSDNGEGDDSTNQGYKVGASIDSEVINVDREERRISLSVKALGGHDVRSNNNDVPDFTNDDSPLTFGDLLRGKLDK